MSASLLHGRVIAILLLQSLHDIVGMSDFPVQLLLCFGVRLLKVLLQELNGILAAIDSLGVFVFNAGRGGSMVELALRPPLALQTQTI